MQFQNRNQIRSTLRRCVASVICVFLCCNFLLAEEKNKSITRRADIQEGAPSLKFSRDLEFSRDIVPLLTKAGCNAGACHGSLQGRGGLALSLLGYDALADYEALFLAGRGRRVLSGSVDQSLVLLKATGRVPHGGGARISSDSESYRLLRRYIRAGVKFAANRSPLSSV